MIHDFYLTVAQLKVAIKDLPDTMSVVYERIEDSYFADNSDGTDLGSEGWGTIDFEDKEYSQHPRFAEDYTKKDDNIQETTGQEHQEYPTSDY